MQCNASLTGRPPSLPQASGSNKGVSLHSRGILVSCVNSKEQVAGREAIALLTDASPALDPARLHQEALLMAAKADVREELDRLAAHIASARQLLSADAAAGRRLDFLIQEFMRETNTLCSKSATVALTAIGLELKATIEQFREQIQNVE